MKTRDLSIRRGFPMRTPWRTSETTLLMPTSLGLVKKAGNTLALNHNSLTLFNYDNFQYNGPRSGPTEVVPDFWGPGRLIRLSPFTIRSPSS
jgi:hypothetical protein